MPKQLKSFSVSGGGEEYLLRIESEEGDTIELTATYDQLDVISEAIDDQLDADEEEALAVQGGE